MDDLVYLDAFPAPDSKARVRARERHGGGLCATALVAAAKLGAKCAYAGVLGSEELSRFSIQELEAAGVDVSQVLVEPDARPHHSSILVESPHQTRTILSFDDGVTPFPAARITPQVLAQARVVFLDHTTRGAEIVAAAREANVPTVADVERLAPGVEDWIGLVDHLIVGEKIARELSSCERAADAVRRLGEGRALAVVTCGEGGYLACGQETQMQILAEPAFVVEAIDTTGCGDVFHGAYAAELAFGCAEAWRLSIASAVAAIKAQHRGGRGGLPSRAEALDFLREHA